MTLLGWYSSREAQFVQITSQLKLIPCESLGRASFRKLSRCRPCATYCNLFLYLDCSGRSLFLVSLFDLLKGLLCGTRLLSHTAKHQVLFHWKLMYEFYWTCASESAPSVAKSFHTLALHLGNEAWELRVCW